MSSGEAGSKSKSSPELAQRGALLELDLDMGWGGRELDTGMFSVKPVSTSPWPWSSRAQDGRDSPRSPNRSFILKDCIYLFDLLFIRARRVLDGDSMSEFVYRSRTARDGAVEYRTGSNNDEGIGMR